MLKFMMKSRLIKLGMVRRNSGFTLLEVIVSLFLLTILTILLTLILQTTLQTSKRFLEYGDYEYGLAHKKIFEIYNASKEVVRFSNQIIMVSKENKEEVLLIFRGDRVFIEKKKNTNSYVGNILLLKKLKSYSINQNKNLLTITIIDRDNKKRVLHLKLKNNNKENVRNNKQERSYKPREIISKVRVKNNINLIKIPPWVRKET